MRDGAGVGLLLHNTVICERCEQSKIVQNLRATRRETARSWSWYHTGIGHSFERPSGRRAAIIRDVAERGILSWDNGEAGAGRWVAITRGTRLQVG